MGARLPTKAKVSAPGGLHDEARCVLEDAVVGDERGPESDGRGGDPSVGIVLTLAECVAGSLAGDAGKGGGFSLHAGVAAEAHESQKLGRLCR